MHRFKDTAQAKVSMLNNGTVEKSYRGPGAEHRFENEVRVLRHLQKAECSFVPRLLSADAETLTIRMTHCGQPVQHLDARRLRSLFLELEDYGVRHNDPYGRNITYEPVSGHFCIIDFEFATLLADGSGYTLASLAEESREWVHYSRMEREHALASA